jgi:ubiquinone/menaquinone biosynthesis C-methylase UbiE
MDNQSAQPSPEHFFTIATAYQQSAVIKGALELSVFTALAEGGATARTLAEKCHTSERGMRILCDYLVIIGFLTKNGDQYGLTQDSAIFLNRNSPAYLGDAVEFLQAPMMVEAFKDIAGVVRKGGTLVGEEGSVSHENPVWVRFARAMAPLMLLPAQTMTQLVEVDPNRKIKLLDIAAGHGIFGITFAQRCPRLEVVAVDWAPVLEVAKENAQKFGVIDRFTTKPGSAFEVDFGDGYDLALLTNFLHHFDVETCKGLLKKVYAALNEGGRALTLDFVPNEDRVTPPNAAGFSMTMLASTRAGDAYTFAEYKKMFGDAGFSKSELHQAPPSPEQLVISYK